MINLIARFLLINGEKDFFYTIRNISYNDKVKDLVAYLKCKSYDAGCKGSFQLNCFKKEV